MKGYLILGVICTMVLVSCSKESTPEEQGYEPTPFVLNIPQILSDKLPAPPIPSDNPLTVEGVALGKKLFFDPILSGDNTLACAGCHKPEDAFTDIRRFSIGIDGIEGFRNSMPIQNLAYNFNGDFFWDGAAATLEEQVLEPVTNPIEMHNTWDNAVLSLQTHTQYPLMFEQAFGNAEINKNLVAKAISQFMRTIMTGNSKFDRYSLGQAELTASELSGLNIFLDENRGDCFHCHGNPNNPLWTDNQFHNNGLDAVFEDNGFGNVTGDPRDFGKFRSPSLRNLEYTAPYMHDGRFQTIDEVINHYSEGLVYSETIDPLMKKVDEGGVQLSEQEKSDLKAFLLTLSDPSLLTNPAFRQ